MCPDLELHHKRDSDSGPKPGLRASPGDSDSTPPDAGWTDGQPKKHDAFCLVGRKHKTFWLTFFLGHSLYIV